MSTNRENHPESQEEGEDVEIHEAQQDTNLPNSSDDNYIAGTSENKASTTAILDAIKRKILVVEKINLKATGLEIQRHEEERRYHYPLRMRVGTWSHDKKSEVWMYMTPARGANNGSQNPCVVEIQDEEGTITGRKTLKTGRSHDLGEVDLEPALQCLRGRGSEKGHNYLPLCMFVQYCFLLKYEETGLIALEKREIPINKQFHRYLEQAIRAYCERKKISVKEGQFTFTLHTSKASKSSRISSAAKKASRERRSSKIEPGGYQEPSGSDLDSGPDISYFSSEEDREAMMNKRKPDLKISSKGSKSTNSGHAFSPAGSSKIESVDPTKLEPRPIHSLLGNLPSRTNRPTSNNSVKVL
ncbi:hypothetical protein BU23DRAFT_12668 [Bimuria novae-zelandiae CBS 107.79]|uniref:Uncharacterized protein n=1 Tax=Bimuria novae-zelandiae CBS 107.79 TaxID=1447943 RepID=A0A6A5VU90_9PLEO|nr:hypothetical protein BU23DRAFT_12668 [Bimuria novae-zelandiae CBS 107.79]